MGEMAVIPKGIFQSLIFINRKMRILPYDKPAGKIKEKFNFNHRALAKLRLRGIVRRMLPPRAGRPGEDGSIQVVA